MKQKDTSKVWVKQQNASIVQQKHMEYIEVIHQSQQTLVYCHQMFSVSAILAMFTVKKYVAFQASWENEQVYTVIRNEHKMSETLQNIGRKQEGISLGIRLAEGSLQLGSSVEGRGRLQ